MPVKVGPGRSFYAVGTGSEIDLIQIEVEDFIFGQRMVNPIGQNSLSYLAHPGLFRRKQERLHDLLCNRASPLNDFPGFKVFQQCTEDPQKVNPPVFIESNIFRGKESLDEVRRHVFQRHQVTAFDVEFPYE
jgi:hypothetical protein